MRILFLSNLYPPEILGGYELACRNVAAALYRRGHDVKVLTSWSHLPLSEHEAGPVERILDLHWFIPIMTNHGLIDQYNLHHAVCSSYNNTLLVLKTLREFQPDIVYAWNLTGIGAAAILDLLNEVGVPWAIHLMDRLPVDIFTNLPKPVLSLFNADGASLYANAHVFSMSRHLLEEIRDVSGIVFPQGADLIPGSVDLSASIPHKPYLRDGVARFVTAGAVAPHKGIDLILEAGARLKADGLAFEVDIYGNGDLPRYIDKAKALHVDDRVRFLGSRDQPSLLKSYASYDAFLFPTWEREPFGFAPVEAAGCATPPIMTSICGAAERLVNGVHCVKIQRTAQDLEDAMRSVCAGQVDLERLGWAGKRLVSTDLSFDRSLDNIEKGLRQHAKAWNHEALDDLRLPLLAYLKHNLSIELRFGQK